MGQAFARRVMGGDTLAHVIGQFEDLQIAEATVGQSALVGKTLVESRLREQIGISVLGVWERGKFELAHPTTRIYHGVLQINPDPAVPLPAGAEMIIVGTTEAEQHFLDRYGRELSDEGPRRPAMTKQA